MAPAGHALLMMTMMMIKYRHANNEELIYGMLIVSILL